MRVSQIMTEGVITITERATVIDAAELMLYHRISGLPVLDARGGLVGMLSQSDLVRRTEAQTETRRSWWLQLLRGQDCLADKYVALRERRVGEVMSRPLVTVSPYATLTEAAELMEQTSVKRLPVVVGDSLVGIITRKDFLKPLGQSRSVSVFPVDDRTILSNVEAELQTRKWARCGQIRVSVNAGIVVLRGTVPDERVRAAARVAAENVAGVQDVRDELTWIDQSFRILAPSPTVEERLN